MSNLGAYDKSDIQAIADAIRFKNGSSDLYRVSDMADVIKTLSGDSYPIEPHDDNNTHLWVEVDDNQTITLYLYLTQSVSKVNKVAINWGDNTAESQMTTSSSTYTRYYVSHTYNTSGLYEIVIKDYIWTEIDPETGESIYHNETNRDDVKIGSNNDDYPIISGKTALKAAEISHKISDYAFSDQRRLENVLIHVGGLSNDKNKCNELNDEAFEYCYALNKVKFDGRIQDGDEFQMTGNNHFQYAVSLKEIIFPEGMTYLAQDPFKYCYNIKSIVFPNSMREIDKDVMDHAPNIESLTIPENVTALKINTGYNSVFKTLIMKPINPPTMSYSIGDASNTGFTIIVPRGSLEAYQTANKWSDYASKMVEADEE